MRFKRHLVTHNSGKYPGSITVIYTFYHYVLLHITSGPRVPASFRSRRRRRHTQCLQALAGHQSWMSLWRGASTLGTRRFLGSGQTVLPLVDLCLVCASGLAGLGSLKGIHFFRIFHFMREWFFRHFWCVDSYSYESTHQNLMKKCGYFLLLLCIITYW